MATIRLFAAAADALGAKQVTLDVVTVGEIYDALTKDAGQTVDAVISRCSFLVDGRRTSDASTPVNKDSTVDVLPPFAGG